MHHANVFYGHARILADYCGLPADEPVPIIWGYLQHGWNLHDGFAVGHKFVPGWPKLVWTHEVAQRGFAAGLRDYAVIGSPWAYLLAHRQLSASSAPPGSGTIVYPFHGWEGQEVVGSHDSYADEIRRAESDGPVTVCLYWNDFERPQVREVYENRGFRVICHGRRGHMYVGGDEDFAWNLLGELLRHRRVVSNRLGSALLYGASLGREIGVYGDPMVLQNDHEVLGGMAKQRRLFPQLHTAAVDRHVATAVAHRELGMALTLSPEALRHAVGWDELPDNAGRRWQDGCAPPAVDKET